MGSSVVLHTAKKMHGKKAFSLTGFTIKFFFSLTIYPMYDYFSSKQAISKINLLNSSFIVKYLGQRSA